MFDVAARWAFLAALAAAAPRPVALLALLGEALLATAAAGGRLRRWVGAADDTTTPDALWLRMPFARSPHSARESALLLTALLGGFPALVLLPAVHLDLPWWLPLPWLAAAVAWPGVLVADWFTFTVPQMRVAERAHAVRAFVLAPAAVLALRCGCWWQAAALVAGFQAFVSREFWTWPPKPGTYSAPAPEAAADRFDVLWQLALCAVAAALARGASVPALAAAVWLVGWLWAVAVGFRGVAWFHGPLCVAAAVAVGAGDPLAGLAAAAWAFTAMMFGPGFGSLLVPRGG